MSAMLAAIFVLAVPAFAQNRSAAAAPSESMAMPPPAWAYPVNPPDFKPTPDDGTLRRVPDSSAAFTLTQLRDRFFAPDWHPGDHPPMPEVVARGRKPDVFACGFCHRADGPGGPENSTLAGLPAAYIIQQMANYKSGARKTSVPQRAPVQLMVSLSRAVTDAEVEAAAAYFSALKPKATIRVVETDTVPKTYVAGWFLAAIKTGDREPIDQRIIEVPEDLEQFNSRDSRARFIAYVPIGSIAKGEALVKSGGGGKTIPCGICHGVDLRGTGPIPGIAGRSPSYVVRQLYDFKHGAWAGTGAVQMKPAVEKLAIEDMVSMAAYLASLAP
ncbi:MAG: c-type cytochrome [Deltaproteobacteria bacterium]|nr:c-type cytochrome [Deltaproteobacteria bacterium]